MARHGLAGPCCGCPQRSWLPGASLCRFLVRAILSHLKPVLISAANALVSLLCTQVNEYYPPPAPTCEDGKGFYRGLSTEKPAAVSAELKVSCVSCASPWPWRAVRSIPDVSLWRPECVFRCRLALYTKAGAGGIVLKRISARMRACMRSTTSPAPVLFVRVGTSLASPFLHCVHPNNKYINKPQLLA